MTNTRKILIVDDDSELREALVEQLALPEEFESIAVDNGTKAVQTAKAGQIDLVIMDAVLLARIRAHLRDYEASKDAVFTIGPYTFRPSSKILLNPEGNEVRLTEKETGVLRYLCRAGQRPVSRETLLQEVWGYNSGLTTHTLETHIYRLRQKIEKDAASPAILVTQAGGYTLVP